MQWLCLCRHNIYSSLLAQGQVWKGAKNEWENKEKDEERGLCWNGYISRSGMCDGTGCHRDDYL